MEANRTIKEELIRKEHEEDLAHQVGALNRLREENERLRQRVDRE